MDIYEKYINKYGVEAQIRQAVGECGEFVADAQNFFRKKIDLRKLMGEAVDVTIMMRQMRTIDKQLFDEIEKETLEKIERRLDG